MTWTQDAPWTPVVDAVTSPDELEAIVQRVVARQLDEFVGRLLDNAWPHGAIDRAVQRATPLLERQTRATLDAGLRRLRH